MGNSKHHLGSLAARGVALACVLLGDETSADEGRR
jgi:hypothetical protein